MKIMLKLESRRRVPIDLETWWSWLCTGEKTVILDLKACTVVKIYRFQSRRSLFFNLNDKGIQFSYSTVNFLKISRKKNIVATHYLVYTVKRAKWIPTEVCVKQSTTGSNRKIRVSLCEQKIRKKIKICQLFSTDITLCSR
jgi:hypothetical protein